MEKTKFVILVIVLPLIIGGCRTAKDVYNAGAGFLDAGVYLGTLGTVHEELPKFPSAREERERERRRQLESRRLEQERIRQEARNRLLEDPNLHAYYAARSDSSPEDVALPQEQLEAEMLQEDFDSDENLWRNAMEQGLPLPQTRPAIQSQ
ncbi:MAG: hypothetical protein AB3N14_01575 [Flavobacteriaceae bacterium]